MDARLVGRDMAGITVYVYSGGSDWAGAGWVDQADTKYGPTSTYHSVGPCFDAQQSVDPFMWTPQANRAMQLGMLFFMWYCWNDAGSNDIKKDPNWWPTITQINQRILSYLQQS
jgi:hypothetical protein